MEKSTIIKATSCMLVLLGIITAGVCIWLIADPVKFGIGIIQTTWDGGDSPKVGITAAILMIVAGISLFLINPEGRFHFFAGALLIILAFSIAFMSVAIKDHQNLKKEEDILKNMKNINILPNFESLKSPENINKLKAANVDVFKIYDKMMSRLKVVAAFGGIDSITLLISLCVLFKYRS